MRAVIPHNKTPEEAVIIVDQSAKELFANAVGGSVALTQFRKDWQGPNMDFSLVASVGFIALPISGKVLIDADNVIIMCELPGVVKTFIGEDKIRAGIERKVRGLMQKPAPPV